jgi:hypothetical protein
MSDANGGLTGSFDGIVILNPTVPLQFSRGIPPGSFDAQAVVEHEIDEVLGLGSILDVGTPKSIKPEDLFRYSADSGSPQLSLNASATATSYFSIDGGVTPIISFNQNPSADRGDWLSPSCAAEAAAPLAQYSNGCPGVVANVSPASPEAIALDVIGYDLSNVPSSPPHINPVGVVPVFSTLNTIQPGSWATIYGSNLAGFTANWKGEFPTEPGGTTVTVDNNPAYLWFVSTGQINFQAPDDTTTGPVNVTVATPAGSATTTVMLAAVSPSFSLLNKTHVAGIILRPDGSGTHGWGALFYDILGPNGLSFGYQTVAAKAARRHGY